jgi:RNA polymerase sigma factor (sigma-70 family)
LLFWGRRWANRRRGPAPKPPPADAVLPKRNNPVTVLRWRPVRSTRKVFPFKDQTVMLVSPFPAPWREFLGVILSRSRPVQEAGDPARHPAMSEQDPQARFECEMLPWLDDAYNLAFWLLKHDQDARDAVQEAYLRAFRFFAGRRIESPKRWLLRIVHNVCLDVLAERSRERKVIPMNEQSVEIPDPAPWPSTELVRKGTREAVRSALEGLPVEFRSVLLLREMEGLSYKEIAAITGLPLGTVMSRLARARRQLSLVLTQEQAWGQP